MAKKKKTVVRRIDADLDAMVRRAGQYGDSFSDAFRRLINLREKKRNFARKTKKDGPRIAQESFCEFIIKECYNGPDEGLSIRSVQEKASKTFQLTELDDEKLPSGTKRWIKNLMWAKHHLIARGYLYPPEVAGRGTCKLTPAGIAWAQELIFK